MDGYQPPPEGRRETAEELQARLPKHEPSETPPDRTGMGCGLLLLVMLGFGVYDAMHPKPVVKVDPEVAAAKDAEREAERLTRCSNAINRARIAALAVDNAPSLGETLDWLARASDAADDARISCVNVDDDAHTEAVALDKRIKRVRKALHQ